MCRGAVAGSTRSIRGIESELDDWGENFRVQVYAWYESGLLGGVEEKIVHCEDVHDLRAGIRWVMHVEVDLIEKDKEGGMERKEWLCLLAAVHSTSSASTPYSVHPLRPA